MTPPIRTIQEVVGRHYGVDILDMLSGRRAETVRPRHVAMYLAKRLTTKSYPQIGIAFNRDHTSVLHAVKRITEARLEDEDLDFTLADLSRRIIAQNMHAVNDALIGWAA